MVGAWNGVSPQVTELGQVTGLSERLDTLVHESAGGCPLMRARHSHFMRLHLLMPWCASIAAPLVLAIAGTPTPWQAAAFGLAMLPLAGVALASQRGALDDAQAIGLAALAGLACVAGVAAGPGYAAGLFLCLFPFEAALAGTCVGDRIEVHRRYARANRLRDALQRSGHHQPSYPHECELIRRLDFYGISFAKHRARGPLCGWPRRQRQVLRALDGSHLQRRPCR